MMSNKDVRATGAAQDDADLRRRNVAGGQNGTLATPKEEIDKKKYQKVRSMARSTLEWMR